MRLTGSRIQPQHAQSGQAATEFIIVAMLFLSLLAGIVEMTYVYRAKHLFNTAVFDAARTGSMHNAALAPMLDTLTRDMAPLYMQTNRSMDAVTQAVAQAQTVLAVMQTAGVPLVIVSPTKETFDKLSEPQNIKLADQTEAAIQNVIPNDNLDWRNRDTQQITVNGAPGEINVQDANLLRIRAFWCQRLVVPALDQIIHGLTYSSPQQTMCDAVGQQDQHYYLAIEADATIRMQSPVAYVDGNLQ
jgi:hypothetical protein